MTTGEIIKKLRKDNKMSQKRLAEILGYTNKSSISKIENGDFELSHAKLAAIATIFGVTVDFLLSGETDERPVNVLNNIKTLYDDGAVELLETYEQLNAAGRKKAVENIKDIAEISKYKK